MTGSITGTTSVCGVIGDPIEHTMSPTMHNAAYRAAGLDFVYTAFHVAAGDLGRAIGGMRGLAIRGLNVTIPHKVAVMEYLDKLDPLAEKIGAVNTISNDSGVLTGFNTDALGALRALAENGIEISDKKIVVLGAGGASRAVSLALADGGGKLTILNRREELDWAEALAARLTGLFGGEIPALEMTESNLAAALDGADLLVNTTSLGMSPQPERTPVSAGLLRGDLAVFDIVYNPLRTRLLTEAEAAGAKTVSGIEMLAWQGALAFEKWTGKPAPARLMRDEAVAWMGKA
jgi:shikimate dehydrogenase